MDEISRKKSIFQSQFHMFKLIVKCRKANVTHMLLPSVFVAVHEEKRKEAAQHKHKERERLEYNRRAVFENRRESLHICT